MGLISLFSIINESHYTIQLAFSFFYSTFSKKFSILTK